MAAKAIVLSLSWMVKETCWSSKSNIVGSRLCLQKHQRLGFKFCLLFTTKSLRFSLDNHLLGKSEKFIQGSEIKTKSGLCSKINLLRANLEGELAKPLAFQ